MLAFSVDLLHRHSLECQKHLHTVSKSNNESFVFLRDLLKYITWKDFLLLINFCAVRNTRSDDQWRYEQRNLRDTP